ncbi:Sugar transporter ERD6-like 16 [Acorus calamus]|uniref:Sugar transporter ERD6-like 16 n=1 Tax=Acorus calamus TaxID=4465 RepID=A0AAV9EZ94_ACOCL|nr:Sugar transporter ERD6-like 16 [Acorus calamus]
MNMEEGMGNGGMTELLIVDEKQRHQSKNGGSIYMVLLSTFVAVCGSFQFGSCVGYSAPAQSGIMEDLGLSLSEGALSLDIGRFCTGYGVGIVSYMAKMGKHKEFDVALRSLRGKGADISEEAEEIQEYIETLNQLPKAGLQDLFQRRYIRSLIIGVGLMVFQQFGGINGVVFYASELFVSAGLSSGGIGTIAIACLSLPITALSAIIIDRCGRRPLLMVSTTGTFIGLFLTGICFYMKVYDASFSVGMAAVPWVIMSEMPNVTASGGLSALVKAVAAGTVLIYMASNSFYNVEGGHRAIVFNRIGGI